MASSKEHPPESLRSLQSRRQAILIALAEVEQRIEDTRAEIVSIDRQLANAQPEAKQAA